MSFDPSPASDRETVAPSAWGDVDLAAGAIDRALSDLAEAILASAALPDDDAYFVDDDVAAFQLTQTWHGVRLSIVALRTRNTESATKARRLIEDLQRESLTLVLLPDASLSFVGDVMPDDTSRIDTVMPLFRADIEALRAGLTTVDELFDFKLVRRIFDNADASDTQYADTLLAQYRMRSRQWDAILVSPETAARRQPEGFTDWIEHPLLAQVRRRVVQGRGVVLLGPSGSGKSVLALQVLRSLESRDVDTGVIEFSSFSELPAGFAQAFLFDGSVGERHSILMLDDLQSQPTLARYCIAVLNAKRRAGALGRVVAVCTTWPEFGETVLPLYEECYPQLVEPGQLVPDVITTLAPRLDVAGKALLQQRFGDDVGILALAARLSARGGSAVSLQDVADSLWETKTRAVGLSDEVCAALALVCGSLSRYDLPTPPQLLSRLTGTDGHTHRIATPALLRPIGEGFSLGHRSSSGLLVEWLAARGAWSNPRIAEVRNSDEVVLEYLRELSPSAAVEALRGLQSRVGFRPEARMARRAAAVVQIWEAFSAVVQRIEHQQDLDPTWGRNPASAMFAVRALHYVGRADAARPSLAFLSNRWAVDGNELRIELEGLSTTGDFIRIGERMLEEDGFDSQRWPDLPAAGVDLERFHRTWLAGVLLTAEAVNPDRAAATRLVHGVEALQEEQGNFYPRRVAWSTARALLGLAACGRTVANSHAVRRAADWLLLPRIEGGACSNGIWMSGTGTWNSTLEATAMVLMALAAVGLELDDERLATARSYLLSRQSQWTAQGQELDGALAAQAVLESGGSWAEVTESVYMLSRWAQGEAFWQTANLGAHESLEQGCRVAQIASHLVDIGWTAIAADLPGFLEALAPPDAFRREMLEEEPSRSVALPAARADVSEPSAPNASDATPLETSDEVFAFLSGVDKVKLSDLAVVGKYRRFDPVGRQLLRRHVAEIKRQLVAAGDWHKNFLIWAPPGTGKSFFISEIANDTPGLRYESVNLAQLSQAEWEARIAELAQVDEPALCLVDEIDARAEEQWPYQTLLPLLDGSRNRPVVFVLVGSHSAGKESLIRLIQDRPKGRDLVDRIPARQRLEIPIPDAGDRLLIFASALLDRRDPPIERIEKLALYYTLSRDDIRTSRQVEDFAIEVLSRLPQAERQVYYDSLFQPGDHENQRFYAEHLAVALQLDNAFLQVIPDR